jgi:hypothetical protein
LFGWTKGKKIDEEDIKTSEQPKQSEKEMVFASKIQTHFEEARAVRMSDADDTGYSIEEIWEDEAKLYKGGGNQWLTNFAYRSKKARQIRPNSEDNFIFNALTIQNANITANMPEVTFSGQESSDNDAAFRLTCMAKFNDERNNFHRTWRTMVHDYTGQGPVIGMVTWDADWMGGRGPDRWVGDVRIERIDKRTMYFDPAILNLEDNDELQECDFIIRRPRKKLDFFRKRFPEKGKYVYEEMDEEDQDNYYKGSNPGQAYLIEYWYRGFPEWVPAERKKELIDKANQLDMKGDYYRAQDYYDASKGELEGIHCAYYANGIFLEHCPYEYEDGLYPFAYTTRFFDEDSPWGFGETRNIKIPQIMHNKADEIELEAYMKEGLGGGFYQNGAINPKQMDRIIADSSKGGVWQEIDNINLLRPREGVRVPPSIPQYKEHKQRVIETVSSNTPVQQGMAPSANMPYRAIAELGARTDVRTKNAVQKLEDFLKCIQRLRLSRFDQFYEEDRYYRIKGTNGKAIEGTFNRDMIRDEWVRDRVSKPMMDEAGQPMADPMTGQPLTQVEERKEFFVPEFDIGITILNEKPTDRAYYTDLAFTLFDKQLLTPDDLLYTLEEGKLPPAKEILQHVQGMNNVMQLMSQMQQLPPEVQQQIMQIIMQTVGGMMQEVQTQQAQMQGQQKLQQKVEGMKENQAVSQLVKGGYV